MTKNSLKPAVRQHFEQRTLSASQLERLETLMDVGVPGPPGRRRHLWPLIGWSATAALAALLVAAVMLGPLDSVPMTERIAMEVAHNQIKLKPLDVRTDNMDGIRRFFTDLEFMPVQSRLLANRNLQLLGGRYCSIQSVPAAQLHISAPDKQRPQTLYQTEYRKDVFGPLPVLENGDVPVEVNVKGVRVRIWVEKGLLFAMTEELDFESINQRE